MASPLICFLFLTFERAAEARVSKAFGDGYGDIGILGSSWILTDILGSVGPLRLAKSSSVC